MEDDDAISLPMRSKSERGWVRIAKKRLPILSWARRYDRVTALADLVAGVTLGLMMVPQSMAYASFANLPVQYGLYSSFVGTMLYVVLGTVKEVSIGPTSLMALFTLQTCRGLPLEYMVLLTFLSGCVVLVMGMLRLGFVVELISPSVTSGFTSGTAVIIIVAQLKDLLGLSFTAESVGDNLRHIAARWDDVRLTDCALSAACCIVLLALRQVKNLRVCQTRPRVKRALWLISISRNALVILGASAVAYILHDTSRPLFRLSGPVEAGLPRVSAPPFSASLDNSTVQFVDMVHQLGSAVIMTPLVMVLANIAIAKAFTSSGVDATQEMLTLGLCNMAGSLVHAMPTCGAFTRSIVSHVSGVRTPAAGLYSGIITLMALMFLTQYFYFIPKACLSSVLICAVIFMIDVSVVVRLWRTGERAELCVLALTFGVCVARTVELAVLAGALGSLTVLLRALMCPTVSALVHKTSGGDVLVVRVSFGATYVNVSRIARYILTVASRITSRYVLFDCSHIVLLDYAATQMFERLIKKMKDSDKKLILYNVSNELIGKFETMSGVDKRTLRAKSPKDVFTLIDSASSPDEHDALLTQHV